MLSEFKYNYRYIARFPNIVNSDLSQHSHEVAILGALLHNERAGEATIFFKKIRFPLKQERDAVIQVRVHENTWFPFSGVTPMSVLVDHAVDKFDETLTHMISD